MDGRRWGSPGEAASGGVGTTSIRREDGDDEMVGNETCCEEEGVV